MSASFRPGTGQRVSASRSGRPGGATGPGVGMTTTVSVVDRPVTNHGLTGIKTSGGGIGRQVQDHSYWLGFLRAKCTEITKEISKLKEETERFNKDNSMYQQLERKYEGLIKEVRGMEGQLADYNLAMDKARTNTEARDLMGAFRALKHRNEQLSEEVDRVFVERQSREQATARLEGEVTELRSRAEEKLRSLPPARLGEYRALAAEQSNLGEVLSARQRELEALNARIGELEEDMRHDRYRDEYSRLDKQLQRLRRERESLASEAEAASMDPATARAKLLQKAKDDNARIKELETKHKTLTDEIARKSKLLTDLSADIAERQGESGESHKYEVLYQRDAEMTDFIDRFPETKEKDLAEQKRAEEMVVTLLEHISQGLSRQTTMPSKDQAQEMKEELSFKTKQLESSKQTQERLEAELAKRQQELEKVNSLDSKIVLELKSLNDRMATMQTEMTKFEDLESLRDSAEATKKMLLQQRAAYTKRRDAVSVLTQTQSSQVERLKSELASSDVTKQFETLESRLRQHEQTIYALREFIDTKSKETEFGPIRESLAKMTDEVNALHIRAQAAIATTTSFK